MDTENKLTVVNWELSERGEGIKQRENKTKHCVDTDNSMVITRGKGRWRR